MKQTLEEAVKSMTYDKMPYWGELPMVAKKYGITHWLPIPYFDDILETNRNVLERIKEKGD